DLLARRAAHPHRLRDAGRRPARVPGRGARPRAQPRAVPRRR
ncbi:MAG: hypothetical protein AVDCRST_MAG85-1965, partial [uncultured Solirubrobacteraceae bacterium]